MINVLFRPKYHCTNPRDSLTSYLLHVINLLVNSRTTDFNIVLN